MATKKKETWRSRVTGENLLKIFENETEICMFDTETTGLNAMEDVIIQISAIKCRLPDMEEIGRIDYYINPEKPLPAKITEITGITDDFLKDKPTEKEIFPEIRNTS